MRSYLQLRKNINIRGHKYKNMKMQIRIETYEIPKIENNKYRK